MGASVKLVDVVEKLSDERKGIIYSLALDMLSAQQAEDFDYYSFEDIKAIGEAYERVSAGNCLSFSSTKEMAAYFGV